MIKETTILMGSADMVKIYDSVDHFFTENELDVWRAEQLQLFTDAGFDITDSTKQQVALSEDGTKVIVTVAYTDQAEKDSVLANAPGVAPVGLVEEISEDHLF